MQAQAQGQKHLPTQCISYEVLRLRRKTTVRKVSKWYHLEG